MSPAEIIEIIQKHSLTVRCLPHEVVRYCTYQEGDETKKYVNSDGKEIEATREVVIQNFTLEHFINTAPPKWETRTPEQRYQAYKKQFPEGRKLLKETRQTKRGGLWYVKETKDTNSTVMFNSKYDITAPTLEQAIELYLQTIK